VFRVYSYIEFRYCLIVFIEHFKLDFVDMYCNSGVFEEFIVKNLVRLLLCVQQLKLMLHLSMQSIIIDALQQ